MALKKFYLKNSIFAHIHIIFFITNVRNIAFAVHEVRAKQGLSFEDTCKKENTEYRYFHTDD